MGVSVHMEKARGTDAQNIKYSQKGEQFEQFGIIPNLKWDYL